MTFNTLAMPAPPGVTKMELQRGSKEEYDFEGMNKEILLVALLARVSWVING